MNRISRHIPALSCLVLSCLLLAPAVARAQGVLINVNPTEQVILPRPPIIIWPPYRPHPRPLPVPESTYKIKALEVNVKLEEQVARVQVSQSFVNTGSRPMEVCFVFPLPYDGAIDQLTLLVDGKEVPAKLLPANEARQMYEEIVRKNRDPALLEWMGTGMFKTSVFPVPPGAERKVSLRYSQLCRKSEGLTDFLFPLSTAKYTSQPVEKIKFHVAIESQEEIKNIYSPTHAVEIKRPDDQHAIVTYTAKNKVPTSDFRSVYDVGKRQVGAHACLSYRPREEQGRLFPLARQPGDQSGRRRAAQEDGRVRRRPLGQHERREDRAGQGSGLKFVLEQSARGRPVQHHRLRQRGRKFRPELQKIRRRDSQGGPRLRRRHLCRGQHEHRRGLEGRASLSCTTRAGRRSCCS